MHWIIAKLIALDQAESFPAEGGPELSHTAFAAEAKVLRRKLPPPIVSAYERLKAKHKESVVGVVQGKCEGCHVPLSKADIIALCEEKELCVCSHCERFIYLAGGHDLSAHDDSHESRKNLSP